MTAVRRDLQTEREFTREAARGYVDPEPLITHAEARARGLSGEYVDDPMLIAPGRDRAQDGREELVDCRNHLGFGFQTERWTPAQQALALQAMRYVLLAHDALLRLTEAGE